MAKRKTLADEFVATKAELEALADRLTALEGQREVLRGKMGNCISKFRKIYRHVAEATEGMNLSDAQQEALRSINEEITKAQECFPLRSLQ